MFTTQEVVDHAGGYPGRSRSSKPPPPPRPPIPVEVPNDVILEDDDLPLGDPLEFTALPLSPPPLPDKKPEALEDEIFLVVEEMPAIIGGQAALFAALTYPIVAQRAGIEGMVIIEITVEPDGTPSNPKVISLGPRGLG